MISQQQTDYYLKACLKTWLICEACIYGNTQKKFLDDSSIQSCRECAEICFAVVAKMTTDNEDNLDELALLCMVHCRQCASKFAQYSHDNDLYYCGKVCIACSLIIKNLISPQHLN